MGLSMSVLLRLKSTHLHFVKKKIKNVIMYVLYKIWSLLSIVTSIVSYLPTLYKISDSVVLNEFLQSSFF